MNKQHQKIMNYMERNGCITPMEAFNNLKITKLSTRVGEMIRDGVPICKEMVYRKNADNETVRYMKYWLDKTN